MAGISDAAIRKLNSENKFNGGAELEEDYGVNLYSTFYRRYDPQIGRFSGVDALSDLNNDLTPYRFAFNNPISLNDHSGLLEGNANAPAILATAYIKMVTISLFEWDNFVSNRLQNDESGGGGGGGGLNENGGEMIEPTHSSGNKNEEEPGPGDKGKGKKKPSKASSIINKTLKIAGTTIIVLGGPEDVVGDGAAVTEVVVGAVIAGVVYLFENVDGNSSFPGPWSYTVRPSSEDPINYPQGFKNDEYPPNSGGPLGWVSAGVALYDIYKTFREKMSDFFTPTMPVHNP